MYADRLVYKPDGNGGYHDAVEYSDDLIIAALEQQWDDDTVYLTPQEYPTFAFDSDIFGASVRIKAMRITENLERMEYEGESGVFVVFVEAPMDSAPYVVSHE